MVLPGQKLPTLMPKDKKRIVPSPELYDSFCKLLLKLFGVLDEIRSSDLTELVATQKIFGKQIAVGVWSNL